MPHSHCQAHSKLNTCHGPRSKINIVSLVPLMGMVWLEMELEAQYGELGFAMRPTQTGALTVMVSLGGLREVIFLPCSQRPAMAKEHFSVSLWLRWDYLHHGSLKRGVGKRWLVQHSCNEVGHTFCGSQIWL